MELLVRRSTQGILENPDLPDQVELTRRQSGGGRNTETDRVALQPAFLESRILAWRPLYNSASSNTRTDEPDNI